MLLIQNAISYLHRFVRMFRHYIHLHPRTYKHYATDTSGRRLIETVAQIILIR